jgi:regulator of protease activity HflC (stomatin/prohibitin superfamily)
MVRSIIHEYYVPSMFFKFVKTSTVGVKTTFGRFTKTVQPGLIWYIPLVQSVDLVSIRVRQKNFKFNVKTKDNVFTGLELAVQYKIEPDDVEKAYFSLSNPVEQIGSYIENTVRSHIPTMSFDQLFESQNTIGEYVNSDLKSKMSDYGYTIVNTLITTIQPPDEVIVAMNKINASSRLKEAAKNEAEAEYIKKVKEAEADRDRKRLQGEGISLQRLAIVKGYEEGISGMSSKFNLSAKDIINFVMSTQHLDVLETIGKSENSKVLFLNHNENKLREVLMQANESQTTL